MENPFGIITTGQLKGWKTFPTKFAPEGHLKIARIFKCGVCVA
jgi:hypothetical protein